MTRHFSLGLHRSRAIAAIAGEDGPSSRVSLPFDLTQRRQSPFAFDQRATIKEQAVYVQDDIKAGRRHVQARRPARSLRRPHDVDARSSRASASPTRFRAAARSCAPRTDGRMETPYNENLVLASSGVRPTVFGGGVPRAARQARSGRGRRPTGDSAAGWSLTSATSTSTRQRLRLRRAVRHADLLPGRLGPFEDRRLHGARQPRRARRVQRVHRHGAHQRDLLAARAPAASCSSSRRATSASTTIRSSTRRPTCSTCSASRVGRLGGAVAGATTPVSWPARSGARGRAGA